ncbi:MAG TPA: DUF58 domain-containing protein [Tissierellia bacterium]|nr:DUF58 domain-containing protein [Tissierellia bacterium]
MKRSIIIILSITLLIYVLFVGGEMPYFLFYIYLSALLVPLIHCLIIYRDLSGSVNVPNKAIYVGDRVAISYTVRNMSKFTAPYIEVENSISRQLTGEEAPRTMTTLNPKGFYTHNEELTLKRRGYYQIGEIEVAIKDVFGFYSIKKRMASDTALIVYPKPRELNSFRITSIEQLGEMLIDDKAFEDRSRISSLREFRNGDSVKSIHWKLSAKLGDLIIKEFDNSADTNVMVFVDNYRGLFTNDKDHRLEDKIADIGISIVNYYLGKNIPVSLQTQDGDKVVEVNGKGKSDLKPFLEAFARFRGNGLFDFSVFMKKRMGVIKKGSTVVIITPNIDRAIGTQGIMLKSKNLNPLFIVATDKENNTGYIDMRVENSLREEGIPVYILDYETNIKAALEGRQ